MKFKSFEEIIDYAVTLEEDAYELYMNLASKAKAPNTKVIFEDFAKEEQGHKKKLLSVKKGKIKLSATKKVLDLKIGDYLVDIDINADLDYQDALILAMKAEKQAYKLYSELAETTDDDGIREMFLALANEEAKHKLRFEIEYDDNILLEN